jgi:hypothetical protein
MLLSVATKLHCMLSAHRRQDVPGASRGRVLAPVFMKNRSLRSRVLRR